MPANAMKVCVLAHVSSHFRPRPLRCVRLQDRKVHLDQTRSRGLAEDVLDGLDHRVEGVVQFHNEPAHPHKASSNVAQF